MDLFNNPALESILRQQRIIERILDNPAVRMIQQQETTISKIFQQQQVAHRVFDENVLGAANQIMRQYENIEHLVRQPYLEIIFQQSKLMNNILPMFSTLTIGEVLEQVGEFEQENLAPRQQGTSDIPVEITVNNNSSQALFTEEEVEKLKKIARNSGTLKGFLMAVVGGLGVDAAKYIITEIIMPILLVVSSLVDESVENIVEGLESKAVKQIQYSQEPVKVKNDVPTNFKSFMGEANQEFLLRAGRMKSAPVIYHEKIQPFQRVIVIGYRGNWLKVEIETAQGILIGWVEGYKINKIK